MEERDFDEGKATPTEDSGDNDIYSGQGREELMDEDEINDVDEGFMAGYEGGNKVAECQQCHAILKEEVVEEEFDGEVYRFCSSVCASKFEDSRKE